MFGQIGGIGSVDTIKFDDKKAKEQPPQQNVAFINSIFDNFGGSASGTEASFNA